MTFEIPIFVIVIFIGLIVVYNIIRMFLNYKESNGKCFNHDYEDVDIASVKLRFIITLLRLRLANKKYLDDEQIILRIAMMRLGSPSHYRCTKCNKIRRVPRG